MARGMEHEQFTSPCLIGFNKIPIHKIVIDMYGSSHKCGESGYRALAVLEIDLLNPCPFGRMRRYTAPGCLLNCPCCPI